MEASTTTPAGIASAVAATEVAASEPAVIARRRSVACRVLDVAAAAVLLVVLTPLFLVMALVIRLDSKGPAIFRQRRIGRDQAPFTVWKFRTMYQGVGHAFMNSTPAGIARRQKLGQGEHNAAAVALGWQRLDAFFAKELGTA